MEMFGRSSVAVISSSKKEQAPKEKEKNKNNGYAEIIKSAREKKGISQKELSKMTGVPRGTIAAWESGYRNLTKLDEISKIYKALGIDTKTIL